MIEREVESFREHGVRVGGPLGLRIEWTQITVEGRLLAHAEVGSVGEMRKLHTLFHVENGYLVHGEYLPRQASGERYAFFLARDEQLEDNAGAVIEAIRRRIITPEQARGRLLRVSSLGEVLTREDLIRVAPFVADQAGL